MKASLFTSKTRVATLKGMTIPRLEFMGAKLLAKLMETVKGVIKSNVEQLECYY